MSKQESNCAFQYYDGFKIVEDKTLITLDKAKELFNHYYDDMVTQVKNGNNIEVAIWINMKTDVNYNETLIHLVSPQVEGEILWEPHYQHKFKL